MSAASTLRSRPRDTWTADLIAGVTVALVLVPQSMAYAELAGMPPEAGLLAGALPPVLAAFFASSPWLQTGPVALTSILTFGALSTLATPASAEYVGLAALLALVVGLARIAIGLLRAGAVSYLMSQAVLRGFTLAAALLITGSQVPSMLGTAPTEGPVMVRALRAVVDVPNWSLGALVFAVTTLVIVRGGRRLHPLFPGVLIAVLFATAGSAVLGYSGATVGEIAQAWPTPKLGLPWGRIPELIVPGVVIALVGFAEAASISQTFAEAEKVPWDPDREFVSQGVANTVAGIVGGFPVGGSFSRSALNHLAGARSRVAGAITGLTVLLALPLTVYLDALPKAVLGAVILTAMLKLLTVKPIVELWSLSKWQFGLAVGTFVTTLALAPRIELGVVLGVVASVAVHLAREMSVEVCVSSSDDELRLQPRGVLWFASAPAFRARLFNALDEHPEATDITLDVAGLGRIDLTGAMQLQAFVERVEARQGAVCRVEGVTQATERILARVLPDRLAG